MVRCSNWQFPKNIQQISLLRHLCQSAAHKQEDECEGNALYDSNKKHQQNKVPFRELFDVHFKDMRTEIGADPYQNRGDGAEHA